MEVLEKAMVENPDNWKKHYHGDEKQQALARKYSYSDRARYYIGGEEQEKAIEKLFSNLRKYPVAMNILHQYMPKQYDRVCRGEIKADPKELAMAGAAEYMRDYEYAAY